jgi:hypothetical protein
MRTSGSHLKPLSGIERPRTATDSHSIGNCIQTVQATCASLQRCRENRNNCAEPGTVQSLFDGAILPSRGCPGVELDRARQAADSAMSAMPRKRRLAVKTAPVGMGHKETHALQQRALYSIISSAVASSVDGMATPRALAVFKLITSSNLVGACTGSSAGFSPLRMRST